MASSSGFSGRRSLALGATAFGLVADLLFTVPVPRPFLLYCQPLNHILTLPEQPICHVQARRTLNLKPYVNPQPKEPKPQTRNRSLHFIFHYPDITLLLYHYIGHLVPVISTVLIPRFCQCTRNAQAQVGTGLLAKQQRGRVHGPHR